jgi:hypothetical protein
MSQTYAAETIRRDIKRNHFDYADDSNRREMTTGDVRYYRERAYNGLLRGDMTRQEYDELCKEFDLI